MVIPYYTKFQWLLGHNVLSSTRSWRTDDVRQSTNGDEAPDEKRVYIKVRTALNLLYSSLWQTPRHSLDSSILAFHSFAHFQLCHSFEHCCRCLEPPPHLSNMLFFSRVAVAATALLIGQAVATPIPLTMVSSGDKFDIVITVNNTINATAPAPGHAGDQLERRSGNGRLPLSLVNNLDGGKVNAYVTGLDSSNRLVMLQPNGEFFYPSADPSQTVPTPVGGNIAIPLGEKGSTREIIIPDYISSARVWFSEGNLKFFTTWSAATNGPSLVTPSQSNPYDPSAAVNWGFVELTHIPGYGLYANISYVDFVGLVLGMSMTTRDGGKQTALGLKANAVASICQALIQQAKKDGRPWDDLCMVNSAGKLLRVLAPGNYLAGHPDAFRNYWTNYVDQVWKRYETRDLTINTQAAPGRVRCRVRDGRLKCDGDNRSYGKPSAKDIYGCDSGPFDIRGDDNAVHRAVVPRLCAAFVRSTALSAAVQPSGGEGSYYRSNPTNWYSKVVHQNLVDGRGYAFPYDDVNPTGGKDQAGVVASPNPARLEVVVGGPLA